jgi:hypothetical protein
MRLALRNQALEFEDDGAPPAVLSSTSTDSACDQMYLNTCGALAAHRSLDDDLSALWRLVCDKVEHVPFGIEHPLHAPHMQGRGPPLRLLVLNHDLHETLIILRYAAPAKKGERRSSL